MEYDLCPVSDACLIPALPWFGGARRSKGWEAPASMKCIAHDSSIVFDIQSLGSSVLCATL